MGFQISTRITFALRGDGVPGCLLILESRILSNPTSQRSFVSRWDAVDRTTRAFQKQCVEERCFQSSCEKKSTRC